ncbi:hypothetical protein B0H15DRAFT_653404 [Mycena belliarum]|uniref:Uncharacterized protein n=1 Tax=Mycena belliarum TaxID=1033014 RepID=A0AAD6TPU1_9AGAR|nr:hypothetical protein B0H15DRAFT_653404 [Mycena belliae]
MASSLIHPSFDTYTLLCFASREPHYLQIIGQSEENAPSFHVVFRDAGVPVQNYIQNECRNGVKKCVLEVLTMIVQFASAAVELLRKDRGGCKLNTAQVCLRSATCNTGSPNFILANFEPSHFYDPTASDQEIVTNGWDIFVGLITQSITGHVDKPNYTTGCHGETGPTVTRIFRFLIHFLIDFRYHPDRQHDGLNQIFQKLTCEITSLRRDVDNSESGSNPLLESMQQYSETLCAIWDLWDIITVSPGDLGIMVAGADPKRPRFQKIANFAGKIQTEWSTGCGSAVTSYPEYAEQQYFPADGCWSSDIIDPLTMCHTLRIGSPINAQARFTYSRARQISFLGDAWNYETAWSYLRHLSETGELSALAIEHKVDQGDLIFVFSTSQTKASTEVILNTADRRDALLSEVGAQGASLYFFENLAAVEGELHGYWAASKTPGTPLWGGTPRAEGPEWGWEHSDKGFKVEIGRTGPVQHIRYVSL